MSRDALARSLTLRYGVEVPRLVESLDDLDLELLATRAGEALSEARALDIVRWAALVFGDALTVASSMSDGVVAHLASRALPGVPVVFLDTGVHFAETLGTRDAVVSQYPVRLVNATPSLSLAEQADRFGANLWLTDPDACCKLRKVDVLRRALKPYRAWVTGLRGDETPDRVGTPVVLWDAKRRMVKINPIARWSTDEVRVYIDRHQVLVNPLQQLGYRSIGCAPCTRPVSAGQSDRAGRWAGRDKVECGIHA
ncbi:MAG: phosphoadenylyl-sulfate reductase [Actinomycetes bacterium]